MIKKMGLKSNKRLFKIIMLYHGSNHIIKSFSDEFVGKGVDALGPGIYFTKDIDLAEKFGSIIYTANIKDFKALSNTAKPNKSQLLNLIKKAEDWEMTMYDWGENLNDAIRKYLDELSKQSEREAFEQIWWDYYKHDPVYFVRNMTSIGFGGSIRTDDRAEVYVLFDPKLIEIIEVKKINESKTMCGTKKSCSCGCSIKKQIKESVQVQRVSDDILSISYEPETFGNGINLDIEKYPDDVFSIVINDDYENVQHFDSFNEMVQSIGNGSDKLLKKVFFNKDILDKVISFGYGEEKNTIQEKVEKEPLDKIIITLRDDESTILSMMEFIKQLGNTGHGFDIIVDHKQDDEKSFYWDGDGSDYIESVELKKGSDLKEYEQEMYDHPKTPSIEESKHEVSYYQKWADKLNGRGREIMLAKATAAEKGLLQDGEIITESKETSKILNLFKKYYKLNKKFTATNGDKFMGFNKAETKIYQDANVAKIAAWDLGRKSNLDTNEILDLDNQAKRSIMKESVSGSDVELWNKLKNNEDGMEVEEIYNELRIRAEKKSGKPAINLQDIMLGLEITGPNFEIEKLDEAKKPNLQLTSNTKRELVKNTKSALDSLYNIYNILEKQGIEANSLTRELDKAFSSTNEMLAFLVNQKSVEKK